MFTNQSTRCETEVEMDSDNLAMMESMLCKEQTIYAQHDYFARSLPIAPVTPDNSCDMPVDRFCRNIMANWCVSLCKFCNYDRRMVASVMSCVDRFISTPEGSRILLDRDEYQLAVMASLYMISKVQQFQALEPESIAKLSRGKYTKANIEAMELDILTSLEWFVNPPTPMGFAHEFIQTFDFLPADGNNNNSEDDESVSSTSTTSEEMLMELVKCQVEEATCDYELSCLNRPSHVAFGALSNALQSLSIDSSQLHSMQVLKSRLQIIDDDCISASLLQIVSSSESSTNALSSLLLDRCSGHSKLASSSSHKAGQRIMGPTCTGTPSSSSVTSSPRAVAGGIIC